MVDESFLKVVAIEKSRFHENIAAIVMGKTDTQTPKCGSQSSQLNLI